MGMHQHGMPSLPPMHRSTSSAYSNDAHSLGSLGAYGAQEHQHPQAGAHQHPEAAKLTNPVAADATSIAAGQKLYAQQCAGCHGEARAC